MIVLIATAGRPDSLRSTLCSIAAADHPSRFEAIIVVENGPPCGAQAICEQMRDDGAPIRFLRHPKPGKSAALNYALTTVPEETLAVMTDDDVRMEKRTLSAYQREASRHPSGRFFGGLFDVRYEEEPPAWMKRYLPPSAIGWEPSPEEFDPTRDRFLGCNWAAFAGDLKAVGGFDTRFGPGALSKATGQESEMQKRLHAAGFVSHLVSDALVWHFVPRERCSPQWAISRARRNGISRGITVSSRGVADQLSNHCKNGLKLAVASAQCWLTQTESQSHFHAAYYRSRSLGYFEGVRNGQRAA